MIWNATKELELKVLDKYFEVLQSAKKCKNAMKC